MVGVQCFNPFYNVWWVFKCLNGCDFDCSELNFTGEQEEDISKSKDIGNIFVIITDKSIVFKFVLMI